MLHGGYMSCPTTKSYSTDHTSNYSVEESKSEKSLSAEQSSTRSSSLGCRAYRVLEWSVVGVGGYLGNGVASIYGPNVVNSVAINQFGMGWFSAYTLAGASVPYLGPVGCFVGSLGAGLGLKGISTVICKSKPLVISVVSSLFRSNIQGRNSREFPHKEYVSILERKRTVFYEAEDILSPSESEYAKIRSDLLLKEM